jgi:hypothetical protein
MKPNSRQAKHPIRVAGDISLSLEVVRPVHGHRSNYFPIWLTLRLRWFRSNRHAVKAKIYRLLYGLRHGRGACLDPRTMPL